MLCRQKPAIGDRPHHQKRLRGPMDRTLATPQAKLIALTTEKIPYGTDTVAKATGPYRQDPVAQIAAVCRYPTRGIPGPQWSTRATMQRVRRFARRQIGLQDHRHSAGAPERA